MLESKPANRALRSGNDIPTSLTPTKPRSVDTQLSIGMALLNGISWQSSLIWERVLCVLLRPNT